MPVAAAAIALMRKPARGCSTTTLQQYMVAIGPRGPAFRQCRSTCVPATKSCGGNMPNLIEQLVGFGPLAVAAAKALAVLVIGWITAGLISRTIRRRVFANDKIDNTLGSFAASIVRWLILLVVVIAIMSVFGIEATSLVVVMGAATLAIGLALQGTLSDLAAGFMLILFRPYKLEQYVDIAGTTGTVKEINLFYTELATPQNVQIVVPNGRAWGSIITNYSHYETRRGDLVFSIGYDDDADKAIAVINELVAADERVPGAGDRAERQFGGYFGAAVERQKRQLGDAGRHDQGRERGFRCGGNYHSLSAYGAD